MKLEIVPRRGVMGLSFGSERAAVRAFFADAPKVFRRSTKGEPGLHWPGLGVFAYFDASGRLEALEFGGPAAPSFSGVNLLAQSFSEATKLLRSNDARAQDDRGAKGAVHAVTSQELGVGIWSELGDPAAPPDSVIVFRDGYYD